MYVIEEIKRIKKTHSMIVAKQTGTPDELANSMCVSRRQVYNILEEMKEFGAKISYSRTKRTFYYTNRFNLEVRFDVEYLGEREAISLVGGCKISMHTSYDAQILHGTCNIYNILYS